ncbi:hypothetical protein T492DRAFT_990012 [Pavlovales sp. CCMP2436]|nr:hypothetical protein T492DRAFT_990012 [Pavlovales sp. CCMP2436]|mmetsp:Transcript_6752/g.16386  ORF Transcript_6752/g.16386 Transcript_6752/m.16386 type:complete len:427 (+) Transcript_6752:117-1397(+)
MSPSGGKQNEVALQLQQAMEQMDHEEAAAREEHTRLASELALRQQSDLRERKRLHVENAELASELEALRLSSKALVEEVAVLRQGSEQARGSEGVLKAHWEDQLEAAALALQAKELHWQRELEDVQARAAEAEQAVSQLRRAAEALKADLLRAREEQAAQLVDERASDQRALKQAQLQLARAAAEADERLVAAREDGEARRRQIEREHAQMRTELERVRDERRSEGTVLQSQVRSAQEAGRLAEARIAALEQQHAQAKAQLLALREVAQDAQLERNRALDDVRTLEAACDDARSQVNASRAREGTLRSREAQLALAFERARQEQLLQAEAHQVTIATVKMRALDLRDENKRRTREVKELRREVESMHETQHRLRDVMTTPHYRISAARTPYMEARRESLLGLPSEFPPDPRRHSGFGGGSEPSVTA